MSDTGLRHLERSRGADGAEARLQLARQYSRVGRAGDALSTLELAEIPDALFPEAKALADSLWHESLARIGPGCDVPLALTPQSSRPRLGFDLAGETLLLGLGWDGGGVAFVDLTTGRVLEHRPEQRSLDFYPCAEGAFARDYVSDDTEVYVRFRRRGDVILSERQDRVDSLLHAVSPCGELLCVLENDLRRIVRWPSFEPVLESPHLMTLDWANRLFVEWSAEGGRVRRMDGEGSPWALSRPTGYDTRLLTSGVLTSKGAGQLWLYGLYPKRWALRIVPQTPRAFEGPNLASDGRGLRFRIGGQPVRVDVDLAQGKLQPWSRSYDFHVLSLKRSRNEYPLFHPHADVVAHRKKGRYRLRTIEGEHLVTLPEATAPLAWSPDGFTLLVMTRGGLALWRVPKG